LVFPDFDTVTVRGDGAGIPDITADSQKFNRSAINPCSGEAAACNTDGNVTAGDAQGIFIAALGLGTCDVLDEEQLPEMVETPLGLQRLDRNPELKWKGKDILRLHER